MNSTQKRARRIDMRNLMLEGGLGVVLAVFIFSIFMTIFSNKFLTSTNFFAVSRAFSLWIAVGFSQMIVLVVGHMNLSVGSIGGLTAVTVGYLFQTGSLPIWLVLLLGLMVGAACGSFNGIIITKTGINAFIITLGTTSVFTGMNYGLTHSMPFSEIPSSITYLGFGKVLGTLPLLFFIMVFLSIVLFYMFKYTVFGRRILATGGNKIAAEMAGINTERIIFLAHLLSGILAGLSGILFVARLGSAHPTIGQNWLLMSFAVPIIGGTSLQGGSTSIIGVVFGGILMTLLSNGLVLLQVDIFWEQFFNGLLVLLAVGIDRLRTVYVESRFL